MCAFKYTEKEKNLPVKKALRMQIQPVNNPANNKGAVWSVGIDFFESAGADPVAHVEPAAGCAGASNLNVDLRLHVVRECHH